MKIKMKTISKNRGFTLIEMMVSVSIFVIVALIVSGVLVQLSAAYKKAQAMRLLMDNLNFALEKINLELREGVNISLSEREGVQFDRLGGGTFCYKKETIDSRDTLVKCAEGCTTCSDERHVSERNYFRTTKSQVVSDWIQSESDSGGQGRSQEWG